MEVAAKLSPSQSIQLMAIGVMLRDGGLELRGEDDSDVQNALDALTDISQEIALQMGGEPTHPIP